MPSATSRCSNFLYVFMNKTIARELLGIARLVLSMDKATYRYDPKHHRRPLGPGWRTSPKGWSKAEMGAKPGPVPKGGVKE
jgi:hypothetical protein